MFLRNVRSKKPRLWSWRFVTLTTWHPHPQKLAITSLPSGCRSVCIVRSRTQATEFFLRNVLTPTCITRMGAVFSSETSVKFCRTTRHYIREDCNRRQNAEWFVLELRALDSLLSGPSFWILSSFSDTHSTAAKEIAARRQLHYDLSYYWGKEKGVLLSQPVAGLLGTNFRS
jgi:hypothetical protein